MRLFLMALLLSSSLYALSGENDRYLLFLEWNPGLNRLAPRHEVLYEEEGVRMIRTAYQDIHQWSHVVHDGWGACGGYWDVTDLVEGGTMPEILVWQEIDRRRNPVVHEPFLVRHRAEIAKLVAGVDADRMWGFLTELSALPDRSATTEEGAKAVQFLRDHADKAGSSLPGFHTWTIATAQSPYEKQPSLIATLPGTDPSLPAIVIGGHMDTFSHAKPGADDDGSGTSVVMEALRTIGSMRAFFKHTIHFAWYAAEERGLVGSRFVVDHFKSKSMAVKAAIQFDMVGYNHPSDAQDVYVITDYTDPSLSTALKEIIGLYTSAKIGETKCGYACSDHANWHRAGVPVVFPFETSFSNMNSRLHTGEDKIIHLDKAHAHRFAQIALAFLGDMADFQGQNLLP